MSDATKPTGAGMKAAPVVISILAAIVTTVSVTFSVSSGSMRPRVERLETEARALEMQFVKIETQLSNLIERVGEIRAVLRVNE